MSKIENEFGELGRIHLYIYFVEESFLMRAEVHECHHFYEDHFVKTFTPDNPRKFMSTLRKEMMLLKTSLPRGIWIRGYENALVGCLKF